MTTFRHHLLEKDAGGANVFVSLKICLAIATPANLFGHNDEKESHRLFFIITFITQGKCVLISSVPHDCQRRPLSFKCTVHALHLVVYHAFPLLPYAQDARSVPITTNSGLFVDVALLSLNHTTLFVESTLCEWLQDAQTIIIQDPCVLVTMRTLLQL